MNVDLHVHVGLNCGALKNTVNKCIMSELFVFCSTLYSYIKIR